MFRLYIYVEVFCAHADVAIKSYTELMCGMLENYIFSHGPVINRNGKLLLNTEVFVAQNILYFGIVFYLETTFPLLISLNMSDCMVVCIWLLSVSCIFFFHMFLCSRFTLRTIINFHRLFSCKHIQCDVCRQAYWRDTSGNCQKVAVFILRNGKWLILQFRLFSVTQFF